MIPWLPMIALAVAGGVGAALRYLVDTAVSAKLPGRYPWGLTIVNLTGSFAIGVVAGLSTWLFADGPAALLAVGLLGGYTTFSTTSVDIVRMLNEHRVGMALTYACATLAASIALAALGFALGGGLFAGWRPL